MDVRLVVIAVIVGLLVLSRRRITLAGLDWRLTLGFACGAWFGAFWAKAFSKLADPISKTVGVPWRVFAAGIILVGGIAGAGMIGGALHQMFPRGPRGPRGGGDDSRQ